eukprot:scaffold1077_cov388-Prasinococcus_capsulatus_cf.AAC.6
MPISTGLLKALDHEAWGKRGFDVKAFIPLTYVEGPLKGIADGFTLNGKVPRHLTYRGGGVWRNDVLWNARVQGRLQCIDRQPTEKGRKEDDQAIIVHAMELGAYVCSNDRFRDHRKDKSLGFQRNRSSWAVLTQLQRFGYRFEVAPGLGDAILDKMWASSDWDRRW